MHSRRSARASRYKQAKFDRGWILTSWTVFQKLIAPSASVSVG